MNDRLGQSHPEVEGTQLYEAVEVPSAAFPYRRQPNNYYCAPTSLQMFHPDQPLEELARLCVTQAYPHGTFANDLLHAARQLDEGALALCGDGPVDLVARLVQGYRIIVHFLGDGGVGHFAPVRGVSRGKVFLADPHYGDWINYPFEEFDARWLERGRWMLVN